MSEKIRISDKRQLKNLMDRLSNYFEDEIESGAELFFVEHQSRNEVITLESLQNPNAKKYSFSIEIIVKK